MFKDKHRRLPCGQPEGCTWAEIEFFARARPERLRARRGLRAVRPATPSCRKASFALDGQKPGGAASFCILLEFGVKGPNLAGTENVAMAHRFLLCAFAVAAAACTTGGSSVVGGSGSGGAKGNSTVRLGGDGSVGTGGVVVNVNLDAIAAIPLGVDGAGDDGVVERRGPTSSVPGQLMTVIRDFKVYDAADPTTNPDFENPPQTDATGTPNTGYTGPWDDKEIVDATLGDDYKPVYKNPGATTLTTHGQEAFDQWYRNVDGTNIAQQIPLTLTKDARGNYYYDSLTAGRPLSPGGGFFPIDDGGQYRTEFGNQGLSHNYSFTVEIHTLFTYKGGEVFNFSGDDDVFVFINNQLVINLGGVHAREVTNVSLDTLGLTVGENYPLDFFMAERHVSQSNMRITTTLELLPNPAVPIY